MLTDHQLNLILIAARTYYKENRRESFICAMTQLETIKLYQPNAEIFQNKEYLNFSNEFNSFYIK